MSNAKRPQGKQNSLARYRSEVKGDPFVLWLDDDETITIPRPTGDQMFEAEEAFRAGTSKDVIRAFCGPDLSGPFLDAVGKEDASVVMKIAEDMQKKFNLGE